MHNHFPTPCVQNYIFVTMKITSDLLLKYTRSVNINNKREITNSNMINITMKFAYDQIF
jgi:hypothetical protein